MKKKLAQKLTDESSILIHNGHWTKYPLLDVAGEFGLSLTIKKGCNIFQSSVKSQ